MSDAVQLAGLWTLPTINNASGGVVELHVSISIGADDEFNADDVDASVSAGGVDLTQTSRPPAGALLPVIVMATGTAFAQFAFDNPGDAPVDSVTVTVGDESATFTELGNV